MPLPPPVTTTTLPVTCMAVSPLEHDPEKWEPVFRKDHAQTKNYRFLRQNHIKDSRIMAGRAEQDEAMPDRVLETQPLPSMKDHAGGIQHAARERETQRQRRQLFHHGVIEHHAATAHGEIKP